VDSVFQDPQGFVTYTRQVYVCHSSPHKRPGLMRALLDAASCLSNDVKLLFTDKRNRPWRAHASCPTPFCRASHPPCRSRTSYVLTMAMPFTSYFPTHLLVVLCILVAAATLIVHWLHYRQRRDIYLAHPPGSIGSSVALTSHSGFGQLLMPYDNAAALSRALAPLRFCLDKRTGAIVVDDSTIAHADEMSTQAVRDETMMTLMRGGQQYRREDSFVVDSPSAAKSIAAENS
jgi:hypothetical protein